MLAKQKLKSEKNNWGEGASFVVTSASCLTSTFGDKAWDHKHFHMALIVAKIVGCSNTCTAHSANDLELLVGGFDSVGLFKKQIIIATNCRPIPLEGQHWLFPFPILLYSYF